MTLGLGIAAAVLLAAAAAGLGLLRRSPPALRYGAPALLAGAALTLAWFAAAPVAPTGADGPEELAADLAPGTPTSDREAQAQALIEQARQAANTGREPEARSAYEAALAIFREAGLERGVGTVLLGIGTLEHFIGQGARARELYAEADAVFRAAGDGLGEARVSLALAELERARFNNEAALAAYEKSQALFHAEGSWTEEAAALVGRSDAERRLRQVGAARRSVTRAGAIYDMLGDAAGRQIVARSLEELATYPDQNDLLRETLLVNVFTAQQGVDAISEAGAHLQLGQLERRAGRPETAAQAFNEASALFARHQAPLLEAAALKALGDLERSLERFEEAGGAYGMALASYREHGDDLGAAGSIAGMAALEFDRDVDGRRLYMEARALFEAAGRADAIGDILLGLGGLDRRGGRVEEARASYLAADALFAETGDAEGRARAALALGDLDRDLGHLDDAFAAYERAMGLFQQASYLPGEAWVHLGLAVALAETDAREASVNYRLAAAGFNSLGMEARSTAALAAAAALD